MLKKKQITSHLTVRVVSLDSRTALPICLQVFYAIPCVSPKMISPSFRRRQTHTDTLTDTLSVRASVAPFPCKTRLGGALLLRLGDATLLESVLEPPGQGLDVPAAASAGSPTALSLGGPVVCVSAQQSAYAYRFTCRHLCTHCALHSCVCYDTTRCMYLRVVYDTTRCMYLRVVYRDYRLHLHNTLAGTNMTQKCLHIKKI